MRIQIYPDGVITIDADPPPFGFTPTPTRTTED